MSGEQASAASSELNNVLQIIASASSMLDGATPGKRRDLSDDAAGKHSARGKAGGWTRGASWLHRQRALTQADLAAAGTGKREASDKPSKQLVMVVDDEQMGLTLMKHVLTEAGFEVITAQSGFECLEQFRQRPFVYALVILDLTMPFMDGEETFKRLRDLRANVPVLLCTGFIQQDRLDRLMSSGLAGFLRKPIAPDEIVALVRRTLAELRYAREVTPGGFSAAM